jgi:serine/threonine protein kinase
LHVIWKKSEVISFCYFASSTFEVLLLWLSPNLASDALEIDGPMLVLVPFADLKKGGIELKHVTSLFTYESTPYFTWETRNQMCPYALVLASEAGAGTEPRTLRNLMDRGVLRHQHNAKRQVFELVAGAVLELHRADIAHGDLKPENLLVYSIHGHLECKVIDLDNTRRKNTEWRRGGTIVYYSPELAEEHRLPDHAGQVQATLEGDRWAIGAILYELVTGQKLVCTLLEKAEGENYEASDADKALEKLVGVKQEVLDDLCSMIRDGGSDYYKQAGELLQKVLKKDKIWRWSIDKMLESSFVKGGATVTSKLPLMDLVKNVNNCSGKLVLRNELSSTGHRTPNPNCPFFLSSLQF